MPGGSPEYLNVTCMGKDAVLHLRSQRIEYGGQIMSASRFEQLCGKGDAKKWKTSLWWVGGVGGWGGLCQAGSWSATVPPPPPLSHSLLPPSLSLLSHSLTCPHSSHSHPHSSHSLSLLSHSLSSSLMCLLRLHHPSSPCTISVYLPPSCSVPYLSYTLVSTCPCTPSVNPPLSRSVPYLPLPGCRLQDDKGVAVCQMQEWLQEHRLDRKGLAELAANVQQVEDYQAWQAREAEQGGRPGSSAAAEGAEEEGEAGEEKEQEAGAQDAGAWGAGGGGIGGKMAMVT